MSLASKLTVVLTLKGRPLHTLRWLWHHDRVRLPFPIIIADGGDDREIEEILSRPSNFPNLNYTYIKYSDKVLQDYWFKLADVSSRVKTEYMLMNDNDDFTFAPTIMKCIEFLESNHDYVSAGSPTGSWAIYSEDHLFNNIQGDLYSMFLDELWPSYELELPIDRACQYLTKRCGILYHVNRTIPFSKVFESGYRINFNNFDINEHFMYVSMALAGKIKTLPGMAYFRQLGTSQNQASNKGPTYNLIYRQWGRDLEMLFTELTADAVSRGADAGQTGEALRSRLLALYRTVFECSPPLPQVQYLRNAVRHFAVLRGLKYRKSKQALEACLARSGADQNLVREISDDIVTVRETLRSPELGDFILGVYPALAQCRSTLVG